MPAPPASWPLHTQNAHGQQPGHPRWHARTTPVSSSRLPHLVSRWHFQPGDQAQFPFGFTESPGPTHQYIYNPEATRGISCTTADKAHREDSTLCFLMLPGVHIPRSQSNSISAHVGRAACPHLLLGLATQLLSTSACSQSPITVGPAALVLFSQPLRPPLAQKRIGRQTHSLLPSPNHLFAPQW